MSAPLPALVLGPDKVYIPGKYAVQRGLVGDASQEAVVILFVVDGNEVRFALAAPNAKDLARKLDDNADQAKDYVR